MSDIMLYDSQTAFQGGMQAGVDPGLVADHQYFKGINISCREGVVDVRPSFDRLRLNTEDLALSAEAYDEAEQNYTNALGILNNLEAIETQKLADAEADDTIATARANPYIAALEAEYGLTLDLNNVDEFIYYTTLYNTLGTSMMDYPVTTLQLMFGFIPVQTPIFIEKDPTEYPDENWAAGTINTALQQALFGRETYLGETIWLTKTRYILDQTDFYFANEIDEAAYNTANTALDLLVAVKNDYSVLYEDYLEAKEATDNYRLTYIQLKAIFESAIDYESIYKNGKFQGAEIYKTNNRSYIVEVINGHIFMVNLSTDKITPITTPSYHLNPFVDRCYFVQAENYMIIQDGISQPKILDGASVRDADPTVPEIPRGTSMAYGHGRIAIQTSAKHFVMSDIYLAYEPENVLKMKEFGFLNEGGGFTVSGRLGNIISLQLAKVADSSTGDGPLLAICENGFASYSINNPRAQWNNIDIAKIQLFGTGLVGSTALCHVSEDILYRSHEGIRSYQVGQREAAQGYKYTELSKEVEPYIQNDMQYNGKFISMEFFDKRMLSLTTPRGMKARTTGYNAVEIEYNEARDNALIINSTLTDSNVLSDYETRLSFIFDNTTTWTTKGIIDQSVVDAQVSSIDADPDDKICRIEKLIEWADSDIGGTYISDLAVIKAYYNAYIAKTASFIDDTYFKGMISFDFSLAGYTKSTQDSQYSRVTTGSYDGIWTGINPTALLATIENGVKHCYATTKVYNEESGMWENSIHKITRRQNGYDNIREKAIECILDTRAMPYKAEQTYVPAPFVYKKVEDITVWITQLAGDVSLEVHLSSDVLDAYFKVGELQLKAKTADTNPKSVGAPQSRAMIPLWDLPYDSDPTTKHKVRLGNEFVLRFIWNGKLRLRRIFTAARKIEQDPQNNIETEAIAYPIDSFNEYRYSSE
jgi:hypothetical protein